MGSLAVATLALGCTQQGSPDVGMDASMDAPVDDALEVDALWTIPDVNIDVFYPDANLDAYQPDTNEPVCQYVDYGSTCHMPCSQPPEERFNVSVRWSGPYCCMSSPGITYEHFEGCSCIDGFVDCPPGGDPRSLCEFCPGTPSGSIGDAGR